MLIEAHEAYESIRLGQFLPYFQPIVSLRTGEIVGMELLARWRHPEHGWIPPDQFIPLAEKDGWIDALTEILLREGFRVQQKLGLELLLSVNISPLQFQNVSLPSRIEALAKETGFPLERLLIEMTESALAHNLEDARAVVNGLKKLGCKLGLDDFGTGYSSLSQLRSLPFDELKVDRSFTSSMVEQRESRKIVAAVVGLGQSLGLMTVAEGVETQQQREMLLWLGCELGQGWLFGKPVPQEDLDAMIAEPLVSRTKDSSAETEAFSLRHVDQLPGQRLAQLTAIYDGVPVGLAFLDTNLRYVNVNSTLAAMHGVPLSEHFGLTVGEIAPEVFPLVERYLKRALAGEAIPGMEIAKPASLTTPARTIFVSCQPARDEGGEVVGVLASVVDVTPLKLAEQKLEECEIHYRYLMELIPQVPWVIDAEGRALDVSDRWLSMTGMKDGEWQDFGWFNALHPADVQATREELVRALATGDDISIDYRLRRPGENWRWMRSRGSPRRDETGKIIRWYGAIEDIDDVKRGRSGGSSAKNTHMTRFYMEHMLE